MGPLLLNPVELTSFQLVPDVTLWHDVKEGFESGLELNCNMADI